MEELVLQTLSGCTVDGMTVKLPDGQLDRKLYEFVAKKLQLIGGKWKGGKVMGFVFPHDPTELLAQITNGDTRNLKKEFQFFATPDALADKMVERVFPKAWAFPGKPPNSRILEPSAGQGAIIKAIRRYAGDVEVYAFELMGTNRTILKGMSNVLLSGDPDFLHYDGPMQFSRIIANPPFSKNQDIDHVRKMYEVLAPGGTLISVMSRHWVDSQNKKEKDFERWLTGGKIGNVAYEDLPAGTFKESGTSVPAILITITKPNESN